ncbi:MAG: SpoIID/LytB domain-containing protein [Endomicrobiales bacterium]|nr:SpoIID/LytB domain-containing protein [Endomicrobiales bacterium]
MKRPYVIFCLLLFLTVLANAQRIRESIIKVGILTGVTSFNISCDKEYYVYELAVGKKRNIEPGNDYLARYSEGVVTLNGLRLKPPFRVIPKHDGSFIRVNGRRYRDNIIVIKAGAKLNVINELGIEDYIYGILPREVNPSWPLESLKAQAVVSRTYALRNLRRHEKDGFDVCNKTHCQVYGGVESEDARSNKAVDKTRGEVLVYKGELAQALFHASCGGHTEDPKYVWTWTSDVPPYLRGRKDRYCCDSPHEHWENKIEASLIKSRLNKAGYPVGNLRSISFFGNDGSGRPKTLKIRHSRGTLNILPAKFRMAVDPWLVKSAMITSVKESGGSFVFKGKGWGHGVGMCQWGAKAMSERGKDYKDILGFYYPGTKVERWEH